MYIIIACYLNAPLNIIAKMFLIRKTNRIKIEMNINDYIDLTLTAATLLWLQ